MAQGSRLNSNRQSYNLSGAPSQQAAQPAARKNAKLYEHTQQHMGASQSQTYQPSKKQQLRYQQ